ncbi:beta family protein [Plantactinospora solaniradicis]|uniref:Beta family protein n=1 Tax=Plantactinospora solaniradicis TaxID=1723736 RepID=A0ABW1K8J6_9ACTN
MAPAETDGAAARGYRPILFGHRGELEALNHLDGTMVPLVTPILRVPATDRGPRVDAARFASELRSRTPDRLVVGIDLADLGTDDVAVCAAGRELARALAERGVPVLPVVRLSDADCRLTEHATAARTHLHRAIVRIEPRQPPGAGDRGWGADNRDATGRIGATLRLDRVLRLLRLPPERCDLVLDLAAVGCAADVRHEDRRVRRIVDWARDRSWRSITVTSGAMPVSLSGLPTGQPSRLFRWDWALWSSLRDLSVDFGDYGLSAPDPATGPGRPLPTLRYTAGDSWWIYRCSRHGSGRDDDRFHDLCRTLVSAEHWPAAGSAFSWGDQEIARRARYTPGPGSTASWIAWGTSHHLAEVVRALNPPGHPHQTDPSTPTRRPTTPPNRTSSWNRSEPSDRTTLTDRSAPAPRDGTGEGFRRGRRPRRR